MTNDFRLGGDLRLAFAHRTTTPSSRILLRLPRSIVRQAALTPICPDTPRLDGKLAVVTGGNAGIGLEISRGLARRGAEVIIAARNTTTAEAACERIGRETGATLHHVPLDLATLESVSAVLTPLEAAAKGRRVDLLVENAGIWPEDYATSKQGHEIAFAVNTLAHHLLVRRLLDAGLLTEGRVVVLTGDIYVRAVACTSDFTYRGKRGGSMAYARSKLGNLWFAAELQRRHPALFVVIVHPGVAATNLGGERHGVSSFLKNVLLIDAAAGAQTPLYCATQPSLVRGGYYHNTMGLVRFGASDPAADAQKAVALWERLEELSAPFRAAASS
jgi:NAD(P)-dependent dehydrogenase (short-subunit alcohol dehydrogenase family)